MSEAVVWLVVLRNEAFKLIARRRTWAGFVIYLVLEALTLLILSLPKTRIELGQLLAKNGLAFEAAYSGLTLATYILLLTMNLIGGVFVALVAADLVSKEVEDGTLRLTLARPISRLQLLTGKAVIGAAHAFAFVLFAAVTAVVGATLCTGRLTGLLVFAPTHGVFAFYDGPAALWYYARAVLFAASAMQSLAGLGFLFSCLRLKPATAAGLTLMVVVIDSVLWAAPLLGPYRSYFLMHHLTCWLWSFEYLVPWTVVARSLVVLAGFSASCWIIGATVFLARDLR